jgi:hypothetical protein
VTSTTGTEKRYAHASRSGSDSPQPGFGSGDFVTSEWEAAADWEVPEGWPEGTPNGAPNGAFFATGPQPLPDWLADLAVAPTARRQAQPPLPRRRDVRRGTAEIPVVPTAPVELAAPATGFLPAVVRPGAVPRPLETLPVLPERPEDREAGTGSDPARPADLPRRRDVHRPDRSAARRASVLAYTGGEPPARTTVKAGGLPVAAARIGVVSVLVAVGAGVIGGEHFGLVGDGEALTAAEGATALSLAPLPSDPRQLTIWDLSRDQIGLEKAAGKVAKALAAEQAEKERKRLAALKKKLAAEKAAAVRAAALLKAERAKAAAHRNAQRDPRAIARILVAERGWSTSQFSCLDALWRRESGWNYRASNPSSGAYGIPQSLPGSKMASVGSDWRTNPVTQIKWGLNYIAARYGTPCGAWAHSQNTGWY